MIHSFLLIGQSNMAGRGVIDEAKEIDTTHIFVLRNGRWQTMFRPINPDRSFSGVSLAESFAERYAEKFGVDVGLICCADGGTTLDQWKEGGLLYENAVFNAKLAKRTSKIVGILWHQGESDCTEELYSTYKVRFEKMINSLKKELNLEGVPVLVGGLGDFLRDYKYENERNYFHVNEELKKLAQDNESIGFVSAEGLTGKPDNLHFNSESLYEFGLRYFEEYIKIRPEFIDDDEELEDDSKRTSMELL